MSSNVFTVLGNAILLRSVLEMLGQLTVNLENNPVVMNDLAHQLGVSKKLSFFDVYSLDDPELLALVPRPVFALLAIIPFTDAWEKIRLAEDDRKDWYRGAGADEPVVWFQQTIAHGCGLIGFLHCVYNGLPAEMINPGSELYRFLDKAIPLKMEDRANLLSDSETFYPASEAVALNGDTKPPKLDEMEKLGQHFVAFVKSRDGHL
jgi:ubiquitin carboxyl-terminal hydrolase L3